MLYLLCVTPVSCVYSCFASGLEPFLPTGYVTLIFIFLVEI